MAAKKLPKVLPMRCLAFLLLLTCPAFANLDLTLDDPATCTIDWLSSPNAVVDEADGSAQTAFNDYMGGALTQLSAPSERSCYLAVLCNRRTGYAIHLTAPGGLGNQGLMLINAQLSIPFNATISQERGFEPGSTVNCALDLTGQTASIVTTFTSDDALPLLASRPHVYRITFSLPPVWSVADGLLPTGQYNTQIEAAVSLR